MARSLLYTAMLCNVIVVMYCSVQPNKFAADRQMLGNIVDSVQRLSENYDENDSTYDDEVLKEDTVCYPDIGCFSKSTGAMNHTKILPTDPKKINTKFYAYIEVKDPDFDDVIQNEYLVDPHKPSTFEVVDATKRLAILVHGFTNNHEKMANIKDALLRYTNNEVGTVILVNWEKGAAAPDYLKASVNTEVVGREIAFLVNEFKTKHYVDPKNVYLIGFSLGAQVAGFSGKFSQSEYNWKFGRITGLDAAAPLFENHPGSYLTKNDADFVDAIHTSAGHHIIAGDLGFIAPYADVDFFPNGGNNQPMCGLLQPTCDHSSSVEFYEASLTGEDKCQFNAFQCKDYETFEKKQCNVQDTVMGYDADKYDARGVRYLTTTKKFPFCQTKNHSTKNAKYPTKTIS